MYVMYEYYLRVLVQDLEEQKRTKYKINGTATTAIEKSNPNRPAKSRLPYSYQEHLYQMYSYLYQGCLYLSPCLWGW